MTINENELNITQMSAQELHGYALLVLDDIQIPDDFYIEPIICETADDQTGLPKIDFTIARKSTHDHIGHVLLKWVADDNEDDGLKLKTYWWLIYDNTTDDRPIVWATKIVEETRVEQTLTPYYAFHTIFAIKAR